MPYITSDGTNIYVDRMGAGPPVLLLHGFTLDHRQWDSQAGAFASEYQVFRMDLRGHGRSETGHGGYTYAATGRDVGRTMVQIGMEHLNPGYLVAHSIAADAALQVALDEPGSLKGVVVVTPAVWGHMWSSDWLNVWRSMRDETRAGRLGAALERFRADALFDGLRGRPELEAVRDMQAGFSGAPWRAKERDEGPTTLDRLGDFKVPLLVLSAERDRSDFRAAAQEIVDRVPGVGHLEFPAAGHFLNLEQPAKFTETVLEFMRLHP
jgi:pimeloyl-ACP methyl ester carboxylesterase